MFCLHCGKAVEDGTVFCPFCGNEADKPADTAVQPVQPDYSEPENSITDTTETTDFNSGMEYVADVSSDKSGDLSEPADPVVPETIETEQKTEPANADSIQPTVVKPPKKPVKRMGSGAAVTVCVLFTVITLILTVCTTAMWAVRDMLNGGMVSGLVKDVNPLYIKAGDVFEKPEDINNLLKQVGIEGGISEISAEDTVGDILDENLAEYGLSEDAAEKLLEKSPLVPYISKVVSAYEDYLLTGVDSKPVTDDALRQTIMECLNYASGELGIKFAPDTEQQLDRLLKDNKDVIRAANPTEALGTGGGYIRYLFLVPVLVVASLITAAVAALAGVITKRIDAALITLGIPTLLCGFACLYVGLFPRVAISAIKIPSAAVGGSIETIGAKFTEIGLSELITGVMLIVMFTAIKVISKKIAAKNAEMQNV